MYGANGRKLIVLQVKSNSGCGFGKLMMIANQIYESIRIDGDDGNAIVKAGLP